MLTELKGQLERITYSNQENGFTIARLRVPGERQLVTVVGNLLAATPGEILTLKGEWVQHPRYGRQFKSVYSQSEVPASVQGIEKYLGSGLIKGIGPVLARRIVARFGDQTLSVVEKDTARLSEIEGIGAKRLRMIKAAWDEQQEIRQILLFLQTHGISAAYAGKIFKQYGDRSIAVIRENPYRLAVDIFGIGFTTADRMAQKLGFEKNSGLRAEAGVLYLLHEMATGGHVFVPAPELRMRCREVLELEDSVVEEAVQTLVEGGKIVLDRDSGVAADSEAVYLAALHLCEVQIVDRLRTLLETPRSFREIDADKAIAWAHRRLSIDLAEAQTEAIRCVARHKVTVLTGGPGTGKTTVIKVILEIFSKLGITILLAAPTGRAAKRMNEATGQEARTIHRLLEYRIREGGFQRTETHPLQVDLMIVDEASMIDTVLMHHLLKALPPETTLVLVGDVHQLPSVGPGQVLRDTIDSGAVRVVKLNRIFRQAEESSIVVNAHRINRGELPQLKGHSPARDFYFIRQEDPEEALQMILDLACRRIPHRFGLDPFQDIQVLAPMNRGQVGTANLNQQLQTALNPAEDEAAGERFRPGDKVMQIRNNYDKDVFNGDIGRISDINPETREWVVDFEGRDVVYDWSELDEVVLAYAISVHKAQGSEYPAVIMPLLTQHYPLLQRNLLYTAVTRARRLVVLVGSLKALAMAVRNNRMKSRYTGLRERLARASAKPG